MALIYWRRADGIKEAETSEENPFPVSIVLGDPLGGATEYLGDASLPVTVTGGLAPARRVASASFFAAAAGDYSAGDVISTNVTDTLGVALQLVGVVDAVGQVAILDKVVAKCSEDSILARLRLHFYRDNPLPTEVEMDDNIAGDWAKTVNGLNKYIGPVTLAAFLDMGTAMSMSTTGNLREMLKTTSATSTQLWVVVEILDAEANETAGMKIDLDFYFLN